MDFELKIKYFSVCLCQFLWNKSLYPDAFRILCLYLTCSRYVLTLMIPFYDITDISTEFELLKDNGICSCGLVNICWLLGVSSYTQYPGIGRIISGLLIWWLVSLHCYDIFNLKMLKEVNCEPKSILVLKIIQILFGKMYCTLRYI